MYPNISPSSKKQGQVPGNRTIHGNDGHLEYMEFPVKIKMNLGIPKL